MEEESLRETTMKLRLREILSSGEWKEKVQFGDISDAKCDLSDIFLKYYGISKNVDWRHEFGVVLRDGWIHNLGKRDFSPPNCEEEEEVDSEDYDYDYADCSQKYRDVFNHRLSLFRHEELPTDKKRNPLVMGKQLIIEAMEEGKDLTNEELGTEAGEEAYDALFKKFADLPRTVLYMATISHSLS